MICPNCVEPLIRNKKKLGECSIWYICPICGLRSRPDISFEVRTEVFDNYKKRINNNKNKFDEETI